MRIHVGHFRDFLPCILHPMHVEATYVETMQLYFVVVQRGVVIKREKLDR
jgi:hypothetical protein